MQLILATSSAYQNLGNKFISQQHNKQLNVNKISFHKYYEMFL